MATHRSDDAQAVAAVEDYLVVGWVKVADIMAGNRTASVDQLCLTNFPRWAWSKVADIDAGNRVDSVELIHLRKNAFTRTHPSHARTKHAFNA